MRPAARIAAAIDLLDAIDAGAAAEKALTSWARKNRYAGSGDRAAIRDIVFDALRRWRSCAWAGGAETGRGRMIGALRMQGVDPAEMFTAEGHAPPVLAPEEVSGGDLAAAPLAVQIDLPDWLVAPLQDSLGEGFEAVSRAMRQRAPVFLRVNTGKATPEEAARLLLSEGIPTQPHPLADTCLEVLENPRRVRQSAAFRDGLVELQDAASQAVVAGLPNVRRVLDYCAGGGGKSLALAARADCDVTAHDIDPARMTDIAVRAERAGVRIAEAATEDLSDLTPFDLVLCDAPCSGSGAWRRTPEAKWRLTPERLDELCGMQARILRDASVLVAPGGTLAYATCSLLRAENHDQARAFLAACPDWRQSHTRQLTPLDGGDGFYVTHLTRKE